MKDILKLARLQIAIIVLFVLFKFIRPDALAGDSPDWIKKTLLSLPNFFEGVIGVLVLTGMGLYVNAKFLDENRRLRTQLLYIIVTIIAGIYTLTQEFKMHNLGGNNVYDPNDVIFSIVGLAMGYLILYWMQPKYHGTE